MSVPHLIGTEEEIEKIIRTYSRIYHIFFGWGKFVVIWIISLLISISLLNSAQTAQKEERTASIKKEETALIQEYNKLIEFEKINKDFNLHIQQWPLWYEGNMIESVNNFISFRWFVLPQKVAVNKNIQLQDKSYFENPNYDIKEIQIFMDNFIYITHAESPQSNYKNKTIPLAKNSLINYFRLSCTKGILLYKGICNQILDEFLSTLYVYDLSQNYDNIDEIFDTIKTTHQTQFCDALLTYVQYTNDNNPALLPIMRECGNDYKDSFNAFSAFIAIQWQLESATINSDVWVNKDLNAYKLISLMQMIFADLQSKKLNQSVILSYNRYVEELIKKDGVEAFYYDVIYLFNNNYLEKNIIKNFINIKWEQIDNTQKILDWLRNLNKWNTVINMVWLEGRIKNQTILLLKDNIKEFDTTSTTENESSLEYFSRTFAFDKFSIVKSESIWEKELQIEWSYRYEDTNQTSSIAIPRKIDLNIIIKEENGSFIVQQIDTVDKKISEFINNYVSNNKQTIQDIYFIIKDNRPIIQQWVQKIDICAKLQTSSAKEAIRECTNTQILITTQHPWKKETIEYTVNHKDGIIETITSSDKNVSEAVVQDFDLQSISSITLSNFILELISYQREDPQQRVIDYWAGQNEKLYIDSIIKKYLEVTATNILEKNGNFLIEITIKDVSILLGYNISSDTLWPLTFRDKRQIVFNNFMLELNDKNIDAIYNFKNDPLQYLSKLNDNLVQQYLAE